MSRLRIADSLAAPSHGNSETPLSTGIGSQVQLPLAIVVVGGMLIGPIMLLIVVPALQIAFLGDRNGSEPSQQEEASETV